MLRLKWELTKRCNLKCKYCSNAESNISSTVMDYREISNDWRYVLDYFDPFLTNIDFLGGEPTLNHELNEIVSECYSRGIKTTMVTNGQQRVEQGIDLINSGITGIAVSVDGDENQHDYLRGKGSWKKAVNYLQTLAQYNKAKNYPCKLSTNSVITSKNANAIFPFILQMGHLGINFQLTHLLQLGRALQCSDLELENEKLFDLYEKLGKFMEENPEYTIDLVNASPIVIRYLKYKFNLILPLKQKVTCNANSSLFCMDAYGKLYGCNVKKDQTSTFFNIKEAPPFERFFELQRDIIMKHSQKMNLACSDCKYYLDCNPCPYSISNEKPHLCVLAKNKLMDSMKNSSWKYSFTKPAVKINSNDQNVEWYYLSDNSFVSYKASIAEAIEKIQKQGGMTSATLADLCPNVSSYMLENFMFNEYLEGRMLRERI